MNHSMVGQTLVLNPHKDVSVRYNCPSCSKSFVRKAHMLRHQQQHGAQKPFNCQFCSKSFKRSDVLRAHQFRCKERGDLPVPEGQSKGRKRSSCVSCVKLRTRCDQETPCARCQELGKECVRTNTPWSNGTTRHSSIARPRSRDGIPISHLLNSPPDEFAGRFPIRDGPHYPADEDGDSALVDADSPSEASHWSEEMEPYDPYVGATDGFDGFSDSLESLTFGHSSIRADVLHVGSGMPMMTTNNLSQALEPRALEVRQALSTTVSNFGSTLPEAQEMLQLGPTIEQITCSEVDHLVQLYFENYHRHCPVLHRPSFQPTLCPMATLLSVMALGGMYADEPVQIQRMRSLLDVIEAYIFSLPGLRDEYTNSLSLAEAPNDETLQYQFEVFQGAYLIIIAQYFSGNAAAKRRARRQRYTRVLDIARSFKLPTAQHPPFLSIPDSTAFTTWIRTESRIRQLNIMLAFDTAMAIFNNVPPRLSFSELDVQLPCDSPYFELASYSDMLGQATFPKPRIKLVDAFQKLFAPPSELASVVEKDCLNCWDMLYLIHCLYTFVWRQTFANPLLRSSASTLFASSNILDPLKLAIYNWKTLWDDVRIKLTREQMKNMGFETSADSYWTLTKLLVYRFDLKSTTSPADGHSTSSFISQTRTTVNLGGMEISVKGEAMGAFDTCESMPSGDFVPASTTNLGWSTCDFMPIDTDSDSQGAHLRRILKRAR